jgi:DNA-binding MarR family transcriptional regulator
MLRRKRKMSDLSLAEYRALAEFRYRLDRFLQRCRRAARDAGLQPMQYQLMLAVKGTPRRRHPTIGEIADRLQEKHNSVIELVNRLERRHLIQRQRDRHDRRVVHLSLTPAGEALLRKVVRLSLTELRTEAPALIEALSDVLGKR